MLLPFKNRLREQFPAIAGSRILVAVSGGVDSVVLTHLSKQINLNISLAHCNFHLRGEESDEDENFLIELADALDIEIYIEDFDTHSYANNKRISIQMAARDLRYQWFEELRQTLGFDYIFTAHHANDNLETVLINLVRGTGLQGLTGIPVINGAVLRPLLSFPRSEIEEYARNAHLQWREDSSNSSEKYLRNRIRHQIIPGLTEINPQLLERFGTTLRHLQQSASLVEDYISILFPKIAIQEDFGYSFNIKMLQTIPNLRAVLYELFRSFGFTEWDDVYDLLETQPGKIVYSKSHRLIKDRENLLLTTIPTDDKREYEILPGEEAVMLPMGAFVFEEVKQVSPAGRQVIYLDQEKLQFPLKIRKWKEGDLFYPLGMEGKKKLSKFFKDEKLSLPQKENCWLLCSGEKVVWVIGYRPDARFGVAGETTSILRLTYTP